MSCFFSSTSTSDPGGCGGREERFISKWNLILAAAGYDPTTMLITICTDDRHAIGSIGYRKSAHASHERVGLWTRRTNVFKSVVSRVVSVSYGRAGSGKEPT